MKIWTADEIETLKARYPHEPNAALARALGVTERMVRGKAHRLALAKTTRPGAPARGINQRAHVWTEEQDAHLRRWWPEVNARVPGRTAAWLAATLGVSRASVQFRASVLGLRTRRFKEQLWSDDELELLDQWLHLPPPTIRKRLAARGFKRTEAAILCQRQRRFGGLQRATGAYSAHQLAEMMGVAPSVVQRWIHKGWLKAAIRGDAKNAAGGPADRWMITPRAVKSFLLDNPTLIQPRGINFVWLMDLFQPAVSLTARPDSAPPRRMETHMETHDDARCAA